VISIIHQQPLEISLKTVFVLLTLAFAATSMTAQAANQPKVDAAAVWKDVAHCPSSERGKVISAKTAKVGGLDSVAVKVKLDKGGKTFTSTMQGTKPEDFKPGSAFCALDYSND